MIRSKRHRVRVGAEDPQVRQRVLDLAPAVEPRPADELVADPVAQERLLDRAGLGVHPVHDRDVAGSVRAAVLAVAVVGPPRQDRAAAAGQALDLAGDPLGLLFLVVGLEALDRAAAGELRPELLVGPLRVARHDRVGRVEDQLRRAVVALELDDRRVGVVPLEVEDVPDVGATPAVDRLVVVADDREVAVLRRERPDPQILRPVRVLVLVDVEVAPPILVPGQRLGRLVEQPDGLEQEVVEVERARALEALRVADREPGDRPLVVVDGVLAQERRVEHLVLGPADRPEDRRWPELAGQRQVLLAQDLLHQRLLVVGVVDDEPPADADRLAVATEDAGTERVERAGLDLATGLADERHDALAQLPGGTVRERHRQDRPRPDALDADQVRDAVGQDAGLAAAGAGEDEERAVGGRDSTSLLRVQAADDLLRAASRVAFAGRRLLGLELASLVRGELRRLLSGERRVVQPLGLCRGCAHLVGDVHERGPGRLRGVVGLGAGALPAARGTHPLIVGRRPSRGLRSG